MGRRRKESPGGTGLGHSCKGPPPLLRQLPWPFGPHVAGKNKREHTHKLTLASTTVHKLARWRLVPHGKSCLNQEAAGYRVSGNG